MSTGDWADSSTVRVLFQTHQPEWAAPRKPTAVEALSLDWTILMSSCHTVTAIFQCQPSVEFCHLCVEVSHQVVLFFRAIYFTAYSKSKETLNGLLVPNSGLVHMSSAGIAGTFLIHSIVQCKIIHSYIKTSWTIYSSHPLLQPSLRTLWWIPSGWSRLGCSWRKSMYTYYFLWATFFFVCIVLENLTKEALILQS